MEDLVDFLINQSKIKLEFINQDLMKCEIKKVLFELFELIKQDKNNDYNFVEDLIVDNDKKEEKIEKLIKIIMPFKEDYIFGNDISIGDNYIELFYKITKEIATYSEHNCDLITPDS